MKINKTSAFGFFLILVLMMFAIPCWWQVAKWLSGQQDIILGSEPYTWLVLAIGITIPIGLIAAKEMKQYKKYKETRINNQE